MAGLASDSFAFVRTADREDAPAKLRANDRASGPTSADLELIAFGLCFTNQGRFVAPQTSVGYLIKSR
jgi:choline dehydrogenase